MKVYLHKKFEKDFHKISDKKIQEKVFNFIKKLKTVDSISKLYGIEKCSGFSIYYKYRINNFRIGIFFDGEKIILERVLQRKEIYKKWPS